MKERNTVERQSLVIGLLLLSALIAIGWVIYSSFVRWQGNRYDLYPRWVGVQAMFREGISPYSEEVSRRSQMGIYGRPARLEEGESQHHFLYPLFIAFTIPHLWLPFPAAITAWLVTGLLMFGGLAVLFASLSRRRLRPWQVAGLALTIVLFRYNVLSWALGQFTIWVLFFLVLTWWLWERKKDLWAGLALTQAIIKPQLVFLLLPLWMGLALLQRRWRFIIAFGLCLSVLILLPMPFVGNWLPDFLHPPAQYERVAGSLFLSPQTAKILRRVLMIVLWPPTAWVWLRTAGLQRKKGLTLGPPPTFPHLGYALALTVAVTVVTTPRIRGYDLSITTLPLMFLILARYRRDPIGKAAHAAAWLVLLVLPWILSISLTLEQLEAVERLIIGGTCLGLMSLYPAVRRRRKRIV